MQINRCAICNGRNLKKIYKNRKHWGYYCSNCKISVLVYGEEIIPVIKKNLLQISVR